MLGNRWTTVLWSLVAHQCNCFRGCAKLHASFNICKLYICTYACSDTRTHTQTYSNRIPIKSQNQWMLKKLKLSTTSQALLWWSFTTKLNSTFASGDFFTSETATNIKFECKQISEKEISIFTTTTATRKSNQ